jgi:hypothetical protein
MKEPSEARANPSAHERAIRFSTIVNQSSRRANELSEEVVCQLIRAADGTSNNLIEADNGSTDDFLNKMRTALGKQGVESRAAKRHRAPLDAPRVAKPRLEREADELCAIFSTIITNMELRLAEERNVVSSRARVHFEMRILLERLPGISGDRLACRVDSRRCQPRVPDTRDEIAQRFIAHATGMGPRIDAAGGIGTDTERSAVSRCDRTIGKGPVVDAIIPKTVPSARR